MVLEKDHKNKKEKNMTRKEHIERAVFLLFLILALFPIEKYFRLAFSITFFVLIVFIVAHVCMWTQDYYKGKKEKKIDTEDIIVIFKKGLYSIIDKIKGKKI